MSLEHADPRDAIPRRSERFCASHLSSTAADPGGRRCLASRSGTGGRGGSGSTRTDLWTAGAMQHSAAQRMTACCRLQPHGRSGHARRRADQKHRGSAEYGWAPDRACYSADELRLPGDVPGAARLRTPARPRSSVSTRSLHATSLQGADARVWRQGGRCGLWPRHPLPTSRYSARSVATRSRSFQLDGDAWRLAIEWQWAGQGRSSPSKFRA